MDACAASKKSGDLGCPRPAGCSRMYSAPASRAALKGRQCVSRFCLHWRSLCGVRRERRACREGVCAYAEREVRHPATRLPSGNGVIPK
eukprot:5917895-Pleurochrysis_carterae.AAC.1